MAISLDRWCSSDMNEDLKANSNFRFSYSTYSHLKDVALPTSWYHLAKDGPLSQTFLPLLGTKMFGTRFTLPSCTLQRLPCMRGYKVSRYHIFNFRPLRDAVVDVTEEDRPRGLIFGPTALHFLGKLNDESVSACGLAVRVAALSSLSSVSLQRLSSMRTCLRFAMCN